MNFKHTKLACGPIRRPEARRSHEMMNKDGSLPRDGFPRITTEGIHILEEGLNGDFRRWALTCTNHPFELPYGELQNCSIHATEDMEHFEVCVWFGHEYPRVQDKCIAPSYEFDTITNYEDSEYITWKMEDIYLSHSRDMFTAGICLLRDAFGVGRARGEKHTTVYERIEDEEACECEPTKTLPEPYQTGSAYKQFSLGDFA